MNQNQPWLDDRRPRSNFTMVDNVIYDVYMAKLGTDAISVYCLLTRFAGTDTSSFPSISTLMCRSGLSKNTVLKAIHALEESGLISVEKRIDSYGRPTSNLYVLLPLPSHDGDSSPREPYRSKNEVMEVHAVNLTVQNNAKLDVHAVHPNKTQNLNKDSNKNTTTKTPAPPKVCEISEPDVVVFDGNSIPEIPELPQSPPVRSEATGEAGRTIVTALINKGITPAKAQVLTQNYDPTLIQKQISALQHRTAIDLAAALIRSIEEDWSVPVKAVTEALAVKKWEEKQGKESEARRQREMATVDKQALEKAWEALEEDKKREIERKARDIITAQPMGSRMLQGVLGAALVRAKCLEFT